MSQQDKLNKALLRLEKATQKTIQTRGYSKDTQNLKLLVDNIKQLIHANTRSASRSQR